MELCENKFIFKLRTLLVIKKKVFEWTFVCVGVSGVVREGLTSPWIPDGWRWGGTVSDHCPIFTQLYTSQDLDKNDLSIAADEIRFIIGADSGWHLSWHPQSMTWAINDMSFKSYL